MLKTINAFFFQHPILKKAISFVLLFFLILLCYELFYELGRTPFDNIQTIRTLMIIAPVICLGVGCYLKGKGKLNICNLTTLLMIAGFSLRIGYAFYTGVNCRQHDVEMGDFNNLNLNGQGHFSYIYTIFSTGKLPPEIKWQFYHPPLWHASVALFMKIMQIFHPAYDVGELFKESIVVASYVSCLTLYGFKELVFLVLNKNKEDLTFSNKNNVVIAISFALLAFHSQFFIMAGWMNNEGMAFMFMVFALLYGIKFHQNRKWEDIILCALMLGLGASTKVSVALICVPLATFFIYDFIDEIRKKNTKSITLKALAFVGICLPIASWFVIRNIIKFNEPAIGVPGIDPYTNSLGVINYSYWQRFGIPNFKGINESIFCILRPNENGYQDYNVWLYTFKCSVFGEYNYWQGEIFASLLLFFNIIISLFSVFCLFFVLIIERKNKQTRLYNIVMGVIFGISIISYIIFQILYPVTCTQDFRYMTLILLPGTYFVGKFYGTINGDSFKSKLLKHSTLFVVISFICFSILYFISCR